VICQRVVAPRGNVLAPAPAEVVPPGATPVVPLPLAPLPAAPAPPAPVAAPEPVPAPAPAPVVPVAPVPVASPPLAVSVPADELLRAPARSSSAFHTSCTGTTDAAAYHCAQSTFRTYSQPFGRCPPSRIRHGAVPRQARRGATAHVYTEVVISGTISLSTVYLTGELTSSRTKTRRRRNLGEAAATTETGQAYSRFAQQPPAPEPSTPPAPCAPHRPAPYRQR